MKNPNLIHALPISMANNIGISLLAITSLHMLPLQRDKILAVKWFFSVTISMLKANTTKRGMK